MHVIYTPFNLFLAAYPTMLKVKKNCQNLTAKILLTLLIYNL